MKLYVGNLPHSTTDDQLNELFRQFGTLGSAKVATDRDTGVSRGFGFVEFANDDEARLAMALNGKDVGGRTIKVSEARPKH